MTPPNAAAGRLLDGLLADPGRRTFEELLHWLLEAPATRIGAEIPRTRRLALLADALATHPRRVDLEAGIRGIWAHPSAVRLLAETGLPTHGTLVKETLERLVDGVVPRLEPEEDLYVLVARLPLNEPDVEWIESLDQSALTPWRPLLAIAPALVADAARLVAHRAAALGLTRELLQLEPSVPDGASPFLELAAGVEALLRAPTDGDARLAVVLVLARCNAALATAHQRLDLRGVSTDILFRLELCEALLVRLDDLLRVHTGQDDGRELASEILRGSFRQRGVRSLVRNTMKRLALKVTEHAAETGEHYVARDRAEWEATGRSAAGGGLITAGTALIKYLVLAAPLSPLGQGLMSAFNYSASFIAMQFAHFTLASKQPAMTGASLAAALGPGEDLERQVELVAGITRSQVAATIGNVFATIPAAVAVAAGLASLTGTRVLDQDTALHSVHGLHPILSLTVPYAILTGVFLWLASLAAGWAANWSAYRGLAEALTTHRGLRTAFGATGAARLGRLVSQHLSGVVGYLALGFLLGFVPVVFSKFVGIPIEVRHVTLQAASLALAAASLYGTPAFHWGDTAWGAAGILLVAVCNIGVSFALAMRTAMGARDLGRAERARLWAAIRQAFRASPHRFLWRPTA